MKSIKEVGGYFELELNDFGSVYHDSLTALNSGRNALKFILLQRHYKKLYIPYYSCDVTLQSLNDLGISFEFYHINQNFEPTDVCIEKEEAILYVNYFGLMNRQVNEIVKKYNNVIIDNSQAFFEAPHPKVDTFYSPRKFFGLPDGGFASCEKINDLNLERDTKSISLMGHLLIRADQGAEAGYAAFKKNDQALDVQPLRKISMLTEKLMRNIEFSKAMEVRLENFKYLHYHLKDQNEMTFIVENNDFKGPLVYPFLRKGNNKTRQNLINQKIYTATYWPNVKVWINGENCVEMYLLDNLIALPIDQRYQKRVLNKMISIINGEI